MGKTYRKAGFIKIGDPSFKKLFNRKLRRTTKEDVESVPSGGAYRKMNDSWDICDAKWGVSWEEFRDDYLPSWYGTEDELRSYWKRHYKYR